jgi:hypothetical protein
MPSGVEIAITHKEGDAMSVDFHELACLRKLEGRAVF